MVTSSSRSKDGRLTIRFTHTPALVGDLEHWQYDTFVAKWRDRELRADAYITFALNPDGTIEQAKMAPTSPAVDFSYRLSGSPAEAEEDAVTCAHVTCLQWVNAYSTMFVANA